MKVFGSGFSCATFSLLPPSYMPQFPQDTSPCGRCCSQRSRIQAHNPVKHSRLPFTPSRSLRQARMLSSGSCSAVCAWSCRRLTSQATVDSTRFAPVSPYRLPLPDQALDCRHLRIIRRSSLTVESSYQIQACSYQFTLVDTFWSVHPSSSSHSAST
ncbi:hypothetical protein BD311DRAFT_769159 [Dichomitus squalens]|uniref:Uncharacterized protein n=1 Tax=Dichomitus squalens TaxID=114155 RepID=A0A4Q9MB19_9APHY|nr:hypothetical protein BD311DRAFT_769159 [Dichomitus squalens]